MPDKDDVHSYGVATTPVQGDGVPLRAEELLRNGHTLLPSGLDASELESLRTTLDEVYLRQCSELEEVDLSASDDADVARALLAYDDRFMELATNQSVTSFCSQVFGDNFVLLQQNGVINRPGRAHYQLRWHRDLPFQHWTISKPLALAALLCIDDFTVETGATHALPGSHNHAEFPSDEFVRHHQHIMQAPAGTFLVMDAMMFHRAGDNISQWVRRGINHLIGLPFLAQQIDLPGMLDGRHQDDPFLSRYLGYAWRPAPSPVTWRLARARRS
ncbi:MAG: phytanoyl-CoA dioxygenase family protein [Solirubrobacteraceae bacterium]